MNIVPVDSHFCRIKHYNFQELSMRFLECKNYIEVGYDYDPVVYIIRDDNGFFTTAVIYKKNFIQGVKQMLKNIKLVNLDKYYIERIHSSVNHERKIKCIKVD